MLWLSDQARRIQTLVFRISKVCVQVLVMTLVSLCKTHLRPYHLRQYRGTQFKAVELETSLEGKLV